MVTKLLRFLLVLALAIVAIGIIPAGQASADTDTLRPNGVGSITDIPDQIGVGAHWQLVDEAGSGDGDSTAVFTQLNAWKQDLYVMQNGGNVGVVESVTVFVRAVGAGTGSQLLRIAVRTLGTTTLGNITDLPGGSYKLYSATWTVNPTNSLPWTWTDIDNVEAGLQLRTNNVQPAYCTQVWIEVEHSVAPTVVTNAATNITLNSATLNGNITNIGAGIVISRGFDYGLTISYGQESVEAGAWGTGTYEGNITGLSPGTLYHFRAKATNVLGTGYGSDLTFMTDPIAPTVSNRAASRVSVTTARLNGVLDDDGGASTTVSIFWGLTDGSGNATNWTNEEVVGITGEGLFNADISGLTLNTVYYFQARAINSEGTDWADSTASFRTLTGVPSIATFLATPDDSTTNVSLQWSWGNSSAPEVVIRSRTDTYPGNVSDGTSVFAGSQNSYLDTGSESGVTKYYSIWGKDGSLYSSTFISALATTSPTIDGAIPVGAPDAPSGWLQSPDPTALENFEPFYTLTNGLIDSWNMPRATGWIVAALLFSLFIGIIIFVGSRGSFMAAALAMCVTMVMFTIMGLVPGWMGFTTVIATVSVMVLQGQEAT